MFLVSLGDSSMRLGVPFIAPRQRGAVGDQQGRPKLPSVGWRTRQSGAPPDSHCRRSVSISFLFWRRRPLQIRGSWRTGHCPVPPADRWRGPRFARGLRGRPLRWRPLAHRTLSGAPPDSPVCQAELDFGCTNPSLLHFFACLLFSVSST
jgi:hypothetical protein